MSTIRHSIFDIESGPQSLDRLQGIIPAFDPDNVKIGNLGEEKAREKIEKARAEHMTRFQRSAALSAVTGEILAIGIMREVEAGKPPVFELLIDREDLILRAFFAIFAESQKKHPTQWLGYYIRNFDLPFIIRRAWKHGIMLPEGFQGRSLPWQFTDLYDTWRLMEYPPEAIRSIRLRDISEWVRRPGTALNFHELIRLDREEAIAYLKNDLWLTWKLAGVMGAMWTPEQVKTIQERRAEAAMRAAGDRADVEEAKGAAPDGIEFV